MCNIYAGASRDRYYCDSRSIRIHGFVTSIRLENEFWVILNQMANKEGQSVPKFINMLYDEILATHKEGTNFTSFLRVACAMYLHSDAQSGITH